MGEQEWWGVDQLLVHPFPLGTGVETVEQPKGQEHSSECREAEDSLLEEAPPLSPVPLHLPRGLRGQSRFYTQYVMLEWLGQGGFGHVFKVRSTVDGKVYAVKIIPLQQQSEARRNKITREVKLLSSLNHENVVHYCTSWIEQLGQVSEPSTVTDGRSDSLSEAQANGPPASKGGVDGSESSSGDTDVDDGLSESEEDEEGDWLLRSLRPMLYADDESEEVIFCDPSAESPADVPDAEKVISQFQKSSSDVAAWEACGPQPSRFEFLYIQMQFCERKTLRQSIDAGLHRDVESVLRLLREILNGLGFIHSQGFIHRDLKPGNIFLDSNDHVKIGDFGLATSTFKTKSAVCANPGASKDLSEEVSFDNLNPASFLTGQVGTTFYIAPEVNKGSHKASYTSKVDMYSLGIILFELLHPPITTAMERAKILSALRSPSGPTFPSDFSWDPSSNFYKITCWLLAQEPQKRPSTGELLQSDLLPPPTAEEQKFIATLEAKLNNPRSTDYQAIVGKLFCQPPRPELEATFEVDTSRWNYAQFVYTSHVRDMLSVVFEDHGARWLSTPFYVPRGSFYEDKDLLVTLMATGGELFSSQFELRYPLARYVARNEIKRLKRYCIDRVQHSHKVCGIHPREIYECAFDIVGPKGNLAEYVGRTLMVAQDVLMKVGGLRTHQLKVHLGHLDLVKIILSLCGIDNSLFPKVFVLLKDFRGESKQLKAFGEALHAIGVKKSSVQSLKGLLLVEGSPSKVKALLQSRGLVLKKRGQPNALKAILTLISTAIKTAILLGVRILMRLCPLLVCDPCLYCLSFQVVLRQKSIHRTAPLGPSVLAQGGAFQHLILKHRHQMLVVPKQSGDPLASQCAVGVSLPLERIVAMFEAKQRLVLPEWDAYTKVMSRGATKDLLIWSTEPLLKRRVELTKILKEKGLRVDHAFVKNPDDEDLLQEAKLETTLVAVIDSTEKVLLLAFDSLALNHKPRVTVRRIATSDLLEHLCRLFSIQESSSCGGAVRMETPRTNGALATEPLDISIRQVLLKQKKIKDIAQLEEQVRHEVALTLGSFQGSVEVLVLDLDKKLFQLLPNLDLNSTVRTFNESVEELKHRFQEQKDYFLKICHTLYKMVFGKRSATLPTTLFVYSLQTGALKKLL